MRIKFTVQVFVVLHRSQQHLWCARTYRVFSRLFHMSAPRSTPRIRLMVASTDDSFPTGAMFVTVLSLLPISESAKPMFCQIMLSTVVAVISKSFKRLNSDPH